MTDLAARAHANLCEFTRFGARLDPTGVLLDADGVVAFRGATDWPGNRTFVRTDPAVDAVTVANAVDEFLLAHGRSAAGQLRVGADDDLAEALRTRDFHEYGGSPEMVCDAPLPDRDPPSGATLRLATSAADVRAYAEIAGHAFRHLGLLEEPTVAGLDNPAVMLGPDVAIALADLDGRPVAGACSVLFGNDGYVGWVACLDDARGHGLGDTVTRAVTNAAFARGAGMVSLEASKFGESTYARMGYREIYRYKILVKY